MSALFEPVAWNSLAAAVLALFVLAAGRIWKRPELLHVLWLVVLVKLVTPGMVRLETLPALSRPAPAELTLAASAAELAALPAVPEAATGPHWSIVPSALWIAGSALLSAFVMIRCARFARAMRAARAAGRRLEKRIEELAGRMAISCPRALTLDAPVPPMVWSGFRRSTLVLPAELLKRLRADETDALITHELAHLERRDPWVRWIELVVTTALWWNPLVWWVRSRIRRAEEQACDRRVLELFPRCRRAYADGIVKTVEFLAGQRRAPQFATGAAGTRHIKERLTMILNPSSKSRLRRPLIPALLVAVLALPIVPGFAEREDAEGERARAELLELEREALELRMRLEEIRRMRLELERRLGETRTQAEAVEARRKIEQLEREGERERAEKLRRELQRRERKLERERASRMDLTERERQLRLAELELREARIYAELTRQAGAGATVEAYERALAEYKTQHADDAAALSEAREAYERALASHRRAALERELDELARRHERLRDAGRDAEAAETAAAMEKLRAEMSRRGARRTHDAAAFEYMLQSMQAELVELQARYAAAGDEARRDELRRSMEIVTRKLRDLEEKMRPGDVR